jgi:hypothetical protein
MTLRLIPLNSAQHRHQGWARLPDHSFAAADPVAPLLLAELPMAVTAFPLAFARQSSNKALLVAVLGLQSSQNLLVDPQGRWQAEYMPACYRAYPFSLQRVSGEDQRLLLCISEQSGLLRESPDPAKGELRFFDDVGGLLPHMQERLKFLETCAANTQMTQAAVDALDAAGLLQPNPVLKGLLRIDEAALGRLSAAQLLVLRDANALPMAYAQLLSMPRMATLQRLLALRQLAGAAESAKPDLSLVEKMFEPGQSDTLHFNW